MAENAGKKNVQLGIFVTLFSSVVGTAIFAAIAKGDADSWIHYATGFMSMTAAVLSAFQTFFHYTDVSQQNKVAAVKYGKIVSLLDIFLLTFLPESGKRAEALAEFKSISEEFQKVKEDSPTVPDSVYNKVVRKAKLNLDKNL